ncbi:Na/Pi cotransporter family protein [Floridanema evergladense]|uniref:Na/Pi cotransporter family protein n=1 Tax=Floridaenema evergladense BLCC-F167 TaxID=3153639 RepID=A0ABV4WMZ8_9CYAN
MQFFSNQNSPIKRFLITSILVAALVVGFAVKNHEFTAFNPPTLELKAYAQKPDNEAQPAPQTESKQAENGESQGKEEEKIDITKMVMGALAGLVLFLYGVTRMADGLKEVTGDRAKRILSRFTTNPFAGVLTGAAATTILDSSSVTIIMVIAMVSAGLLTFVQSLGVVMGSNIGTTIGAQIIAFEINQYAPIALLIGAILIFFGRNESQKHIGMVTFGVGLLFFGLEVMGDAMEPLEKSQTFINWMQTLGQHPLQGALIGALFTVLIQSSSATVGIIVTLASQGLISLPAGIALMLGAEIGTCSDTIVATIGRGSSAIRTGVFHLFFNLITAALGLIFATQLAQLAQWISFGADVPRQIANAQLIFNLLGVALFIGFTPWIASALQKLIPGRESDNDRHDDSDSGNSGTNWKRIKETVETQQS